MYPPVTVTQPTPAPAPAPAQQHTIIPSPGGGVDIYVPSVTPTVPQITVPPPSAVGPVQTQGPGVSQQITPSQAPASVRPLRPPQSISLPTPENRPTPTTTVPTRGYMGAGPTSGPVLPEGAVPSPSGAAPAPATTGSVGGVPPQDQPGMLGKYLPEGTRNTLVDALAALQGIRPGMSPMAAFGNTFAGAQQSQQTREERKRQLVLEEESKRAAAEEKSYQRGRDKTSDEREERKLKLEEAQAEAESFETAARSKKLLADAEKLRREAARKGISPEDLEWISARVIEKSRQLYDARTLNNTRPLKEGDKDDIDEELRDFEKDLIDRTVKSRDETGAAGTATTPAPAAPATPAGGRPTAMGGNGQTYGTAMTIPPGSPDQVRAQVAALPPGTFYINQADGKVYQRSAAPTYA